MHSWRRGTGGRVDSYFPTSGHVGQVVDNDALEDVLGQGVAGRPIVASSTTVQLPAGCWGGAPTCSRCWRICSRGRSCVGLARLWCFTRGVLQSILGCRFTERVVDDYLAGFKLSMLHYNEEAWVAFQSYLVSEAVAVDFASCLFHKEGLALVCHYVFHGWCLLLLDLCFFELKKRNKNNQHQVVLSYLCQYMSR